MVETLTTGATVEQALVWMIRWPGARAVYRRKEFNRHAQNRGTLYSFTDKGLTYQASLNYVCDGPYSDEQKVTLLGWAVTVWHPLSSLVSADASLRFMEPLDPVLQKLRKKVRRMCHHARTQHLRTTGNCLNEYKCLDCGKVYEIDSSD